jgi:hypothetical protein
VAKLRDALVVDTDDDDLAGGCLLRHRVHSQVLRDQVQLYQRRGMQDEERDDRDGHPEADEESRPRKALHERRAFEPRCHREVLPAQSLARPAERRYSPRVAAIPGS